MHETKAQKESGTASRIIELTLDSTGQHIAYHGLGKQQISLGGKNSKPQGMIIMSGKLLLYIVHIL